MSILFKATDDQVKEIGTLVCKASKPVGMGMLHYDPNHKFPASLFDDMVDNRNELSLDYMNGRMVKVFLERQGDNWLINNSHLDHEYQSWLCRYKSYEELIEKVGGKVIKEAEEAPSATV